jgi:hypothetical protein
VSSFLWPCKALHGCLTWNYGSTAIHSMTNACFAYCNFTSCSSGPGLCCLRLFIAAS